jgi:hypothetical protein
LLDSRTGSRNGAGFPSGPALTPACGAGADSSFAQLVIIAVIDTTKTSATTNIELLRRRRM